MINEPFSLRHLAFDYCQFIARHSQWIGGIDGYQMTLTIALLLLFVGLAVLARRPSSPLMTRLCSPWVYCCLLIVALLCVRLPTFLPGGLNPDESMLIAGAMKLRKSPVFWRSLDGTTSGPLNYYALALLSLLGLPLDYATARLLNVICVGGATGFLYATARVFLPDWIARLASLPLWAAALSFRGWDFIHYSSECISVLLIGAGTWLLLESEVSKNTSRAKTALLGAIIVLIPFAKLQAIPVAGVFAVGSLVRVRREREVWRRGRQLWLLIGAGITAVSVLLFLLLFGIFDVFWQSYIRNNILYANSIGGDFSRKFSEMWFGALDVFWYQIGICAYLFFAGYYFWSQRESSRQFLNESLRAAFLAALLLLTGAWWLNGSGGLTWQLIALSLLIGVAVVIAKNLATGQVTIHAPSFLNALILSIVLASAYAVYRPKRAFPHYLVLLLFPLALAAARTLAAFLAARQIDDTLTIGPYQMRAVALFVLFTLALPVYLRGRELMHESEAWMLGLPKQLRCDACRLISRFAAPGDRIAVWGWSAELYVLTGAIPASREPYTERQISGGPQQTYYRRRFIDDLQLNPPNVFVDAVGRGQFAYQDRAAAGHEIFPDLASYVSENFNLAGDIEGVRVYARKESAPQLKPPIRIACGRGGFQDTDGNEWKPDDYYSGGGAYHADIRSDKLKLPALYESERYCYYPCQYVIPIENGSYLVRLHFAEAYYHGEQQRVFDVRVNQNALIPQVDIYREAGFFKPYVLSLQTTVSAGALEVSLIPRVKEAKLNGIEVLAALQVSLANCGRRR